MLLFYLYSQLKCKQKINIDGEQQLNGVLHFALKNAGS